MLLLPFVSALSRSYLDIFIAHFPIPSLCHLMDTSVYVRVCLCIITCSVSALTLAEIHPAPAPSILSTFGGPLLIDATAYVLVTVQCTVYSR